MNVDKMREKLKAWSQLKWVQAVGAWLRRLACVSFDVAMGIGILWLFKTYLLKWVLDLDIHQVYAFVKSNPNIVQWIVWPTSILIVFIAFRDVVVRVLDQIPPFIQRSQYGGATIVNEPPKKHNLDEEELSQEERKVGNSKEENSKTKCAKGGESSTAAVAIGNCSAHKGVTRTLPMTIAEARRLADLAVKRIAKDFGIDPPGAARMRGTNYVFDAILQDGPLFYGVDVKCGYNRAMIDRTLRRLEMFRFSLPKDMRNRFTVILCVISVQPGQDWRVDLMHRAEGSDLIIRTFSPEELEMT